MTMHLQVGSMIAGSKRITSWSISTSMGISQVKTRSTFPLSWTTLSLIWRKFMPVCCYTFQSWRFWNFWWARSRLFYIFPNEIVIKVLIILIDKMRLQKCGCSHHLKLSWNTSTELRKDDILQGWAWVGNDMGGQLHGYKYISIFQTAYILFSSHSIFRHGFEI